MIHVVLVAFNNPQQTQQRFYRDILPALTALGQPWKLTVVDNSAERSDLLAELVGTDYLWQEGRNLMYGPSLNLAVPRHPAADFVLYVCTKHGMMRDTSWIADLLAPFSDPDVMMSGHLRGSNSPTGVAHDGGPGCEWVREHFKFMEGEHERVPQHIQGGVWMARTGILLRFPYPVQFPHSYTDHLITWQILKAGYKCADVPSVLSVWRERIANRSPFAFIHDEWEVH